MALEILNTIGKIEHGMGLRLGRCTCGAEFRLEEMLVHRKSLHHKDGAYLHCPKCRNPSEWGAMEEEDETTIH